ncbi:hypothetical protein SO802_025768 [Lithocarpus litseifolius]|uniref:Uncharacterized protein n=1 Tax=Lithocarpus litseifolius TaxID=425828 RepID=A0AAW2BZU6_9ROSI
MGFRLESEGTWLGQNLNLCSQLQRPIPIPNRCPALLLQRKDQMEVPLLEATLGRYQPSYVWWSLLAARDVILEGTRWRVGDGTKVEVLSSCWLSHKPVFMGEEMLSTEVSEFIDTNTWQWNRLKVCETFAPRTRKEILAIPLNRTHSRDCLIWKENRRHEFTVKSAYQTDEGNLCSSAVGMPLCSICVGNDERQSIEVQ